MGRPGISNWEDWRCMGFGDAGGVVMYLRGPVFIRLNRTALWIAEALLGGASAPDAIDAYSKEFDVSLGVAQSEYESVRSDLASIVPSGLTHSGAEGDALR